MAAYRYCGQLSCCVRGLFVKKNPKESNLGSLTTLSSCSFFLLSFLTPRFYVWEAWLLAWLALQVCKPVSLDGFCASTSRRLDVLSHDHIETLHWTATYRLYPAIIPCCICIWQKYQGNKKILIWIVLIVFCRTSHHFVMVCLLLGAYLLAAALSVFTPPDQR